MMPSGSSVPSSQICTPPVACDVNTTIRYTATVNTTASSACHQVMLRALTSSVLLESAFFWRSSWRCQT